QKANLDTHRVATIIYKHADGTRIQASATTEIFTNLLYLKERCQFVLTADQEIFNNTIGKAERLAIVYGFGTTKCQHQEARELATKALNLLASLRHLESEESNGRTLNKFGNDFIQQLHQARSEQSLLQRTFNPSNQRRGRGSNGHSQKYKKGRGNSHFYEKERVRSGFSSRNTNTTSHQNPSEHQA
ncbi:hypothetical protein K501DRAFT_189965, partial [Backusella circina FSU 941]